MANIISKLKTASDNTEYSIRATTLFSSRTGGNGAAYMSSLCDSNGQTVSFDSYHHGLSFLLAFHTVPTMATPTLNMNLMGAVPLYWGDSQSPMGKIVADTVYLVTYVYRGNVGETARFVITNPGSESGGGVSTPGINVFAASPMGTQTEQTTNGNVYLNHVVGTQITSSEQITGNGEGVFVSEEGGVLQLYNSAIMTISTTNSSLDTFGTVQTDNSNTYLNYGFVDEGVSVRKSIKITGTGGTTVSYSSSNKTMEINSSGSSIGIIKNVLGTSGSSASNSTSATLNNSTWLNQVVNGVVTQGGNLKVTGSNGVSVSAINGVLTISGSGGGGGSMEFTQADFGVMGAFVGFLDDGTTQTPIAVEPARPDLKYDNYQFSRQGVVKPFLETRGAIPAYHTSSDSHPGWIITSEQLDRSKVLYVDKLDLKVGVNGLIAIPVVFDYSYNEVSNRFESVPYVLLPNYINEHSSLAEFYDAGNAWIADQGEDDGSYTNYPIAPLLENYTFENGSIMDSYDPTGPGPM